MDECEKRAIGYLPQGMRSEVISAAEHLGGRINEIRLRKNKPMCLSADRRDIATGYICTERDMESVMSSLCQGSLYSYAENIKDGFIAGESGIRAGVCGRAVIRDGRIDCVRDITSVNIRIPHRVKGAADELYSLVMSRGSTLVYSKPAMGKTTALRELIPLLSDVKKGKKVSVIDTRYELYAGIEGEDMADVFSGYPRPEGMLSAVRTMSPEYIICDEIGDEGDTEAILRAHSAGVKVVASAHGDSVGRLSENKSIRELLEGGVFSALYGIKEDGVEVTLLND